MALITRFFRLLESARIFAPLDMGEVLVAYDIRHGIGDRQEQRLGRRAFSRPRSSYRERLLRQRRSYSEMFEQFTKRARPHWCGFSARGPRRPVPLCCASTVTAQGAWQTTKSHCVGIEPSEPGRSGRGKPEVSARPEQDRREKPRIIFLAIGGHDGEFAGQRHPCQAVVAGINVPKALLRSKRDRERKAVIRHGIFVEDFPGCRHPI